MGKMPVTLPGRRHSRFDGDWQRRKSGHVTPLEGASGHEQFKTMPFWLTVSLRMRKFEACLRCAVMEALECCGTLAQRPNTDLGSYFWAKNP
jgi:hypothetical protein